MNEKASKKAFVVLEINHCPIKAGGVDCLEQQIKDNLSQVGEVKAVIPLLDGSAIPVHIKGGGGGEDRAQELYRKRKCLSGGVHPLGFGSSPDLRVAISWLELMNHNLLDIAILLALQSDNAEVRAVGDRLKFHVTK